MMNERLLHLKRELFADGKITPTEVEIIRKEVVVMDKEKAEFLFLL